MEVEYDYISRIGICTLLNPLNSPTAILEEVVLYIIYRGGRLNDLIQVEGDVTTRTWMSSLLPHSRTKVDTDFI